MARRLESLAVSLSMATLRCLVWGNVLFWFAWFFVCLDYSRRSGRLTEAIWLPVCGIMCLALAYTDHRLAASQTWALWLVVGYAGVLSGLLLHDVALSHYLYHNVPTAVAVALFLVFGSMLLSAAFLLLSRRKARTPL